MERNIVVAYLLYKESQNILDRGNGMFEDANSVRFKEGKRYKVKNL